MEQDTERASNWPAVIGRSLAFLCLVEADLRDKDLATQARFLEGFGLTRKDAAAVLGTSSNSLGVLLNRTKKKGAARGRSKKK